MYHTTLTVAIKLVPVALILYHQLQHVIFALNQSVPYATQQSAYLAILVFPYLMVNVWHFVIQDTIPLKVHVYYAPAYA